MVLWWVLLRTPSCEANVTTAHYYETFRTFLLFKVLKVSFGGTLVVELTRESLFEHTTFQLRAMSWQLFQFGISQHLLGAEQCSRD